jgi:hypothetical protein
MIHNSAKVFGAKSNRCNKNNVQSINHAHTGTIKHTDIFIQKQCQQIEMWKKVGVY